MVDHLYVHIPFCSHICPYCSFYKELSDPDKIRNFLKAVLSEAEIHADTLRPKTVFFGGGTPSALSIKQLEMLLTGLHERIDFSQLQEWTLEMNPATVSKEKAHLLKNLGVTRISMGVQAWDAPSLKTLGRIHSAQQAFKSYETLRSADFASVNLDLIFGVPGQTLTQWVENLETTVRLQPDHISAYCLSYEEDTAFFELWRKGEMGPNEERDAELFERTMGTLERAGYHQYEISNYCRKDQRCLHNLAYWKGSDFIGLGPSAVSTVGGYRWMNVRNTSTYIARIQTSGKAADEKEEIPGEVHQRERLAFGLRTDEGVAMADFPNIKTRIPPLIKTGYLIESSGFWKLTRKGILLADEIATELWGG